MSSSSPSLIVMVLIVVAAALSLFAWWLSDRNNRRTAALVEYIRLNRPAFWQTQSRALRSINPASVIEAYRRSNPVNDAEFHTLYQARKEGTRMVFLAIIAALTPIGLVIVGTRYWGWHW